MISIEGAGDGGGRGVFSAIPPSPFRQAHTVTALLTPPTPLAVVTRFLLNEVIYRGFLKGVGTEICEFLVLALLFMPSNSPFLILHLSFARSPAELKHISKRRKRN